MSAARRLTLTVFLFCFFSVWTPSGEAQSGISYAINDDQPVSVALGEGFSLAVRVTNNGSFDIVGFSFYVDHDPTKLQIESLTPGDGQAIVPAITVFSFEGVFSCSNGAGLAIAQVTSFAPDPPALPVGGNRIVGVLEYTSLMAGPDDSTTLSFGTCVIANQEKGEVDTAVVGTTLPQVEPPALAAPDLAVSATPGPAFIRGDCNASASVDLVDVITLLDFVFLAGPVTACPTGCDFDGGGTLGFSDVILLVAALYSGIGPNPAGACEFGNLDTTECSLSTLSCP